MSEKHCGERTSIILASTGLRQAIEHGNTPLPDHLHCKNGQIDRLCQLLHRSSAEEMSAKHRKLATAPSAPRVSLLLFFGWDWWRVLSCNSKTEVMSKVGFRDIDMNVPNTVMDRLIRAWSWWASVIVKFCDKGCNHSAFTRMNGYTIVIVLSPLSNRAQNIRVISLKAMICYSD